MPGLDKNEKIAAAQAAASKRSAKSNKKGSKTGHYIAMGAVAITTIIAASTGVATMGSGSAPKSKSTSALDALINDNRFISSVSISPSFTAAKNPFFDKWTVADVKYGFDGVKVSELVGMAGAVRYCEVDDSTEGGVLPMRFNARDHWPECFPWDVVNSGNCSSSYAIAAAQSLSARFCVADQEKYNGTHLSAQQVLSCDKKSRGCRGGGVDSVWSYIERRGLYPDSCLRYAGKSGADCKTTCEASQKLKTLSHCVMRPSEAKGVKTIKREIMERGPVVAPVHLRQDFMVYSGGVFSKIESVAPLYGSDGKNMFAAVVIIGWGRSEGVEYWIIENSWGKEWGESGFGKVAIGAQGNLLESMVVVGHPETAEALEQAAKVEKERQERLAQAKIERAEREERIAAARKARMEAEEASADDDNFDDVDDLDAVDDVEL